MTYKTASSEPLDVIRANECEAAAGLATSRFQALWNEIERLRAWVADLQSGMYVNCVYCGHRYGPGETTPVSMADALKAHVEKCPEHPMSRMREALDELYDVVEEQHGHRGDADSKCPACRAMRRAAALRGL